MEVATLHFDTYRAVNLLKERGYTKKQAEGFIDVMQEVTLSGVATKKDLADAREELKDDIQSVRNELKEDIQALEVKVEKLNTKIDEKIDSLKSFMTSRIYIGQATAVVAVISALKLFGVI